MSDNNQSDASEAQEQQATHQQTSAEPPKKPTTTPGISLTSEQLKERLDRARETERAELIKALGVGSLDDVKAAIEAKRLQEEAQKSLEERLAGERAEREKQHSELMRYRETVSQRARFEIESLSDDQRAAVVAIAGDDPAQQLSTITALRPTWIQVRQAEQPADVDVDASASSPPPPATTIASRSQPGDGSQQSTVSYLAEYERLKLNPETRAHAAVFGNRYQKEIAAERASR